MFYTEVVVALLLLVVVAVVVFVVIGKGAGRAAGERGVGRTT